MFNPGRLIIARKRKRLTGKGLAEKIGISPVTISRIEQGLNEPDPLTIDSFVEELRFPRMFFFGGEVDELTKEAASFRSLTSMTARERDAALSSGQLAYMLSDWASERFNLPEPDLIDLSYEESSSAAARTIRQHWGLGEVPISSMIKLLESKGIKIFSLSENNKNVDAFSCWRYNTPYIFLNTFKSSEHSRFDAAHELGHLLLHKHGGPHGRGREVEREANNFASSFLMPRADVISRLPFTNSIDRLISIKKRWRVSLAALVYRMHALELLTDWQYRTLCIQINKRGYRTSEPDGIEREESVVWKQVLSELWSERITKSHIASDLGLPVDEIEGLVFGLVNVKSQVKSKRGTKKPTLKIV